MHSKNAHQCKRILCKLTDLYTHLKIVHHLGKSQSGGGHRDTTVATTLYATMIIGVRLIARVTNHVHFICNRKRFRIVINLRGRQNNPLYTHTKNE